MSGDLSTEEVAALLAASQRSVGAETAALGARARVRPAEGEWCANEIMGHLIEAERRGFAGRIRAILAEPGAPLATWDQPAVALARRDDERATRDLLDELAALRAESLELVRTLGPVDLLKGGIHPRVGALSIGELLHEWVHHDREHLGQLLDVTNRFAWAGMGVARRFTDPEA